MVNVTYIKTKEIKSNFFLVHVLDRFQFDFKFPVDNSHVNAFQPTKC